MSRTSRIISMLLVSGFVSGLVAGCGGRELDVPESLVIVDYPANTGLTLTFVMKSCSDTCSAYEAPECTVEQADEGNVLTAEVSVPYSDKEDADATTLEGCSLRCGPPILAHCALPALAAGAWTIEAGTRQFTIQVR